MIIQHCEKCNEPIAQYVLIEDMKDGEDIYGWLKYFQKKHNYDMHPNFFQRRFWMFLDWWYE